MDDECPIKNDKIDDIECTTSSNEINIKAKDNFTFYKVRFDKMELSAFLEKYINGLSVDMEIEKKLNEYINQKAEDNKILVINIGLKYDNKGIKIFTNGNNNKLFIDLTNMGRRS